MRHFILYEFSERDILGEHNCHCASDSAHKRDIPPFSYPPSTAARANAACDPLVTSPKQQFAPLTNQRAHCAIVARLISKKSRSVSKLQRRKARSKRKVRKGGRGKKEKKAYAHEIESAWNKIAIGLFSDALTAFAPAAWFTISFRTANTAPTDAASVVSYHTSIARPPTNGRTAPGRRRTGTAHRSPPTGPNKKRAGIAAAELLSRRCIRYTLRVAALLLLLLSGSKSGSGAMSRPSMRYTGTRELFALALPLALCEGLGRERLCRCARGGTARWCKRARYRRRLATGTWSAGARRWRRL